jgi:multidrug efflux system outer membrane protein
MIFRFYARHPIVAAAEGNIPPFFHVDSAGRSCRKQKTTPLHPIKIASCFSLALAITGCTVGPNYQRPALDLPGGFRDLAPALSSNTASMESIADAKWATVFEDEQLQGLIRTALQQNYDIRLAAERVLEAQAQVGLARSDQLPSAGADTELQSQRQATSPIGPSGPPVTWNSGLVGATAAWELDFWGKYRRATEAAKANLVASEWGQKAVLSTLVTGVASGYFRLRALDLQLEITQRTLKSRQESLRLTTLLADSGSTTLMDQRQAEQLVYTAAAAIPELQQQIAQQENSLSILLGQNPGSIPRGKKLTAQSHPPSIPAGIPSQLVERRPDIRAAEQRLIAANAQIGVAKAAFFPEISLTGNAGFQSSALTSLFTGPAGFWTLTGGAAQPLFTGGKLRSNVKISESQQRQAVLTYKQTVQNAFREVSDALVAYQKTSEARQEQEKLVNAAQDASRLSNIRYEAEATSYLEVLTNETNYYSAQLGLAQTDLNQLLALVQVYGALGGGWQ